MRKSTTIVLIAAALFAGLWLQAELDRWRLRAELQRQQIIELLIYAEDAQTGDRLSPKVTGLPSICKIVSETGPAIRASWIGSDSIEIVISSHGYHPQSFVVGPDSQSPVTAKLRPDPVGSG